MNNNLILMTKDARGVYTLTLNNPDNFNALSGQMLSVLQAALDAVKQDDQSRAVVLAASGKAFCPGHNLKEMAAHPTMAFYLALVAQCDLAVASAGARFATSGINYGLFCATPSVPLVRSVQAKHAMHMLVTGEFIDAATALRYGLVNTVAADDTPAALDAEIEKIVCQILSKPRLALQMGKALFYQQQGMGLEAAYQLAGQTMAVNMLDPCAQEGVQAFIEKRAPRW